jgi:hypothetical protein
MHARGLRAKGLRLELTLSVPPSRASPSRPEQQPIQQPTPPGPPRVPVRSYGRVLPHVQDARAAARVPPPVSAGW